MIALPPQTSFETLFTGGPGAGPRFSPGPMTLISNLFSDHNTDIDCRSFSHLLTGAMASPASQILPTSMVDDFSSSKQPDSKKKRGGFKQNRTVDLVIAQSPSGFRFPYVFSPSGFLNSPGFFSPLQDLETKLCGFGLKIGQHEENIRLLQYRKEQWRPKY
ncbi:hypothetical protein L1887_22164 [Cichorium endivia]|nr:hypothetical protein L1887_22164 [Cichorium endivia]